MLFASATIGRYAGSRCRLDGRMPDPSQSGACIFISYAHEDEDLKLELDKHLKVLKRSSKVQVWSDREIASGDEWNQAIKDELDRANIILLLIASTSTHLISSGTKSSR